MQRDLLLSEANITSWLAKNFWQKNAEEFLNNKTRDDPNTMVYNHFPFPISHFPFPQQIEDKQNIEIAVQAMLDAWAKYPESSLADFYEPIYAKYIGSFLIKPSMPLMPQKISREAERVAFLFGGYESWLVAVEN